MNLAGSFLVPGALALAVLAPIVWLALVALDRARSRRLARLVGPRGLAVAPVDERRRALRRGVVAFALLLAALAAAQPLWGESARTLEQRGVDVVVCLDVSRSMLARDEDGRTRLAAGKRAIRELCERAKGDRMGLVVFAGEAKATVPLTRDLDSFAELAAQADTHSVGRGGTDLGAALDVALRVLSGGAGEHAAIVVLTDGEDLAGRGLAAARRCAERRVAVHCVGLGSAQGAKITVEGPRGGEAFLVDKGGREVVSSMDPASLRRLAETTGGEFVEATGAAPLVALYDRRVVPMARRAFESRERRERENRFQWPLAGVFLLLLADVSLTERRRR